MVTSPVKKSLLYELATVVYGRSIRCGNQSIYYNGYQSNQKKNCYIIMATSPTKKKFTILYELATVVYGRSIRCGNQSIYIIMVTSPA